MAERRRVAIVTDATPSERDEAFVRRLARNPAFDLSAIILDESVRAGSDLGDNHVTNGAGPLVDRALEALWALWERDHPPRQPAPPFESIARSGTRIERVTDIHSSEGAELLRSARPDLLVSCSARMFDRELAAIPRCGATTLQFRKPPEHFGTGPVGYWELLDGEAEITATVHLSGGGRDAWGRGGIIGRCAISIQPYDTLRSLDVKAGIAGFELYLQALEGLAADRPAGLEPARPCGFVRVPPGQLAVATLERQREDRQRFAYEHRGWTDTYQRKATTWLKYLLVYPLLQQKRRELVAKGQAPIIALFYHRVANDAGNLSTLPLEKFVQQIELIRRYYPILPLEEALRRLECGHNDEVAFVITFDDGYAADFETSIPYLRWHGIPATFFVSIGNIVDGRLFEHDVMRGITTCPPMTVDQLRSLDRSGVEIGLHGLYHEDVSTLTHDDLERAIRQSKMRLEEVLGKPGRHFAFPRGGRGHISRDGWDLAAAHYEVLASAYSGFNFAKDGKKHIKRTGHPYDPIHLIKLMDGYTGITDLGRNNLWAYRLSSEPPYRA